MIKKEKNKPGQNDEEQQLPLLIFSLTKYFVGCLK